MYSLKLYHCLSQCCKRFSCRSTRTPGSCPLAAELAAVLGHVRFDWDRLSAAVAVVDVAEGDGGVGGGAVLARPGAVQRGQRGPHAEKGEGRQGRVVGAAHVGH